MVARDRDRVVPRHVLGRVCHDIGHLARVRVRARARVRVRVGARGRGRVRVGLQSGAMKAGEPMAE